MSVFKQPNLTNILSLLNEDKQTVFNEQPEPVSLEEKREFAESLKSFSQLGESIYAGRPQRVIQRNFFAFKSSSSCFSFFSFSTSF
jgi:hypothetical protein